VAANGGVYQVYIKSNRENKICLIGSLGTDINTLTDPMRAELQKMVDRIVSWLELTLQNGREKGLFHFSMQPGKWRSAYWPR
jgi:hypothetical protein